MTFLGLERPVEYLAQSFFDPTMALMVLNTRNLYINALRDEYLRGREDLKEFSKEYGDFMSPFAKDMARYGEMVGGIKNTISNAYAQGIDLLRSPEGRALITLMISSINPAEFNAMRSNAKTGYAYLDALQKLRQQGKFSQALEDWDILQSGDTPFADFATSNGTGGFNTWGRTSPIESTTLRDLTFDSYKGRTARDLTKADFESDPRLKNYAWDPRYQWSGYLDSDLMKVAPGASASLAADPRASYFRELARQKVEASGQEVTPEAVEKQFQRDIADANAWALIDPTKKGADEWALLAAKNAAAERLMGLRNNGRRSGNGSGNDNQDYTTTFMDRLQLSVNQSIQDKHVGSDHWAETLGNMINYWDQMAKKVENKGRITSVETSIEKVPESLKPNSYYRYMFGGLPTIQHEGSDVRVFDKENKKTNYDQSQNARYNLYTYERDRWLNFGKTGRYQVSKYDTSEDAKKVRKILAGQSAADSRLKSIRKKYEAGGDKALTKDDFAFIKRYEKNKKLVDSYIRHDVEYTTFKANSNAPAYLGKGGQVPGTTSVVDLKRRSSKAWDMQRAEGLSSHQIEVLSGEFNGSAKEVKDPNLENSYKELTLRSNYSYAPVRQSKIAGPGRFKYNQVESKFDRWLHSKGVTLMSFDGNNVDAAIIPTNRIGGELDIMKYPVITKEQFNEFYEKAGGYKLGTKEDVARRLGLGVHKKPLKYKGRDEVLHETDTYYSVPVIGTFDSSAFRDINVRSDKLEFGGSVADKNSWNSENQALEAQLLLESALGMLE